MQLLEKSLEIVGKFLVELLPVCIFMLYTIFTLQLLLAEDPTDACAMV